MDLSWFRVLFYGTSVAPWLSYLQGTLHLPAMTAGVYQEDFFFFNGLNTPITRQDMSYWIFFSFLSIFFFFLFSSAAPMACGGSQARGRIRATASSLHHSHSNAGSEPCLWSTPQLKAILDPTHWARPGVEPTSSWILVRFVSVVPWWELLIFCFSSNERTKVFSNKCN